MGSAEVEGAISGVCLVLDVQNAEEEGKGTKRVREIYFL